MFWKTRVKKSVKQLTSREKMAVMQKQFGIALLSIAMFSGVALAASPAINSILNKGIASADEGGEITPPPCTSDCGTITPPPCTSNCGPITAPPVTITAPPCTSNCGPITAPPVTVTSVVGPIVTPTPTPLITPIATPTPTPLITPIATPTPTPLITPIATPTPTDVPPGSPAVRIDHLCLPVAQNATGATAAYSAYLEDCGDFKPGDTIWYHVRVTNTGTAVANNLSVAQPVLNPQYIENCNITFPQTRASLDVGGIWDFRYNCVVKTTVPLLPNLDVNSTATIIYGNPGLGNNTSDTAVFHIKQTIPQRAIALEKFCVVVNTTIPCNSPNSGLKAGSVVTYTLRVTNSGRDDLTVNTLVDTYDAKISAVSAIVPTGTWDANAGTVSWTNLGLFAAGAHKDYTFNATLGDKAIGGSLVKNSARVTAQDGLNATAQYDFTVPSVTTTTTVAPPVQRTGAADVFLLSVFIASLGAGAYFFLNSGKLASGFGGNKGAF